MISHSSEYKSTRVYIKTLHLFLFKGSLRNGRHSSSGNVKIGVERVIKSLISIILFRKAYVIDERNN